MLLGGGYQFGVVATRHIPIDTEVLVQYGVQHWLDLLPPLPTSDPSSESQASAGAAPLRPEVVEQMTSRMMSFEPLVCSPSPAVAINQMSEWGLTKFRIDPELCNKVLHEAEATFDEAQAHPQGLTGSPLCGQIRDRYLQV